MIPSNFTIGIIISTYNSPEWLEKTLYGYMHQTCMADEIVIADDGSKDETRLLIEKYKKHLPITHVWQPDEGFQKSRILNKALVTCKSDYIIFTDQDCIPREDFISTHKKYSRKGHLLSGGYFNLPLNVSKKISNEDIHLGRAFSLSWLREQDLPLGFRCTKLLRCRLFASIMNIITPTKATWNGCNASGWRDDLLKTNGFNEEMQYGGQDREFGERLFNMGIKPIQIRYSATLLHLYHKRPYKTNESMEKNRAIRRETRHSGIVVTPHGIKKSI